MPLSLQLGRHDLVDVEEAVLLEADLDERGLHPGQHVVDGAEVDVPGDRAPFGALEVDLGDAVVLQHGDALLADVDRDQQLALRRRKWPRLRRLSAAARLRPLARTRRLRRSGGGRGARRTSTFLLLPLGTGLGRLAGASLPAATAAAALGPGGLFARLWGGLECYGLRCLRWWSGSLDGRLLLGLTTVSKPAQRKSPSFARAAAAPSRAARSVRGRL